MFHPSSPIRQLNDFKPILAEGLDEFGQRIEGCRSGDERIGAASAPAQDVPFIYRTRVRETSAELTFL
jgi:hypothetical protein